MGIGGVYIHIFLTATLAGGEWSAWTFYSRRNSKRYPLKRRFYGLQSRPGAVKKTQNILSLLEIEARLLGYWTPSPILVPTTNQKSYKNITEACNMPVGLLRNEEGFFWGGGAIIYIGFKSYWIKWVYIIWHILYKYYIIINYRNYRSATTVQPLYLLISCGKIHKFKNGVDLLIPEELLFLCRCWLATTLFSYDDGDECYAFTWRPDAFCFPLWASML